MCSSDLLGRCVFSQRRSRLRQGRRGPEKRPQGPKRQTERTCKRARKRRHERGFSSKAAYFSWNGTSLCASHEQPRPFPQARRNTQILFPPIHNPPHLHPPFRIGFNALICNRKSLFSTVDRRPYYDDLFERLRKDESQGTT